MSSRVCRYRLVAFLGVLWALGAVFLAGWRLGGKTRPFQRHLDEAQRRQIMFEEVMEELKSANEQARLAAESNDHMRAGIIHARRAAVNHMLVYPLTGRPGPATQPDLAEMRAMWEFDRARFRGEYSELLRHQYPHWRPATQPVE